MASTLSQLEKTISSLPIVDTHTHLREWSSIEQPATAYTLFNCSGFLRQAWVSAGALSRGEYRQSKRFLDWPSMSAAIEKVRTTAFYRILLDGLRSLYEIDFDELDQSSFETLGRKMTRAYQDPGWYAAVLKEKAGLEVICLDSRSEVDRSLFTPIARLDYYVMFGHAGWGERVVAKHGGERTSTIDALVGCLRKDFNEAVGARAAAIKSNDTWARPLSYEDVSEAAAEDALALCNAGEPDARAEKTLGDFMMNQICVLCAEHDIPLQIHTGPAMGTDHVIQYGNPLNLNSLILRNPETRFVLFHAGGPFVRECASLAVQFQNVYLDLCGVLCRESLRRILDDWLEYVPHGKFMWGTDVNLVEEAYAVSLSFRKVLARLLTDRVESGYFSRASAEDFARGILGENARRILRLQEDVAR